MLEYARHSEALRRGAGVVDQDRLLSDCLGERRDRGFESRPLRQFQPRRMGSLGQGGLVKDKQGLLVEGKVERAGELAKSLITKV